MLPSVLAARQVVATGPFGRNGIGVDLVLGGEVGAGPCDRVVRDDDEIDGVRGASCCAQVSIELPERDRTCG